jgi:hypothetical protein
MCMEDVKIGRATNSGDGFASIPAATAGLIVGPSLHRYCLIISPPIAGHVTIGFSPNQLVDGSGVVLASGADPLILTIQEHGDIIRRAFYAIGDGTIRVVGFMQSILEHSEYGTETVPANWHLQSR